jgi:hypothetical protein
MAGTRTNFLMRCLVKMDEEVWWNRLMKWNLMTIFSL